MKKYLLAFLALFLVPSMALADQNPNAPYEILEETEFIELQDYDQEGTFKCEIVVVVVNLNNNYETQRRSFWGDGNSWNNSRSNAFREYGRWIGSQSNWRTNHRHRFHFNNCFDQRGGGSGRGGDY